MIQTKLCPFPFNFYETHIRYLNGSKAGSMVLHKINQYPLGSVAVVAFLWHQTTPLSNATKIDNGKIWIWSPLGTENSVYALIQKTLHYGTEEPFDTLTTASSMINGVHVSRITDMIKFQFFGARSHALLGACLQLRPQTENFQSAGHQVNWAFRESNLIRLFAFNQ